MRETIFTVSTDREQVELFCNWAEKYKTDFNLPELKQFQNMTLESVCKFLIKNYHTERGEIILRPSIYYEMTQTLGHGLDCDDAFIFMAALMRSVKIPKEYILVCEASETVGGDFVHIFAALETRKKIIWLDNLPGCKFNQLDYPKNKLRVTRFSDYV